MPTAFITCQVKDLNEDEKVCPNKADLQVTYPTGAIGDEWFYLCLEHFVESVNTDVKVPADGWPIDWVQKVRYLEANALSRL